MSEEDLDRVHELVELLFDKVHDLVDDELSGEDPEVEDLVRLQMTEQFRFWK
jgi:hypothetical protein